MDDPFDHIRARFSRLYEPYISIGKGWYPLLLELDAELTAIDPDLRYAQIKEKWAELRVYVTSDSAVVRAAIHRAEAKSRVTCESCGAVGSIHQHGSWYRTLCESCAAETNYVPYQGR